MIATALDIHPTLSAQQVLIAHLRDFPTLQSYLPEYPLDRPRPVPYSSFACFNQTAFTTLPRPASEMELKYQHLDFLVHNLSQPQSVHPENCAHMPVQQHCETQLLEVCAGLSQVSTPLEQKIGMNSMLLNPLYLMSVSCVVQFRTGPPGSVGLSQVHTALAISHTLQCSLLPRWS